VALLGNKSKFAGSSGQELFNKILSLANKKQVLVVGTVNIHTRQSEQLLDHLDSLIGANDTVNAPVYQPGRRKSALHVKLHSLNRRHNPSRDHEHSAPNISKETYGAY
jgi:hypothetical protein